MTSVQSQKAYNAGILQGKAYRILTAQLTSALIPFKLSIPEWKLLGQLADNGSMKLARLADLLGVEAPLITSLVDSLEKKGLVKRTEDKVDKRAKIIQGTKKAMKLVEKIEPTVQATMKPLLHGITEKEFRSYMHVLEAIVKNSAAP
ncbi:MAG: MarR family transcriptional regulator [Candidatus Levybacteria bacterium]|nr:MarR family transcriptional regulator [Candidatus Levybacteria bacterium]